MDESRLIGAFETVLKELKDEKHSAAGTMTAQQLHGLGGLFSASGTDPLVFSTYVRPKSISNVLSFLPTVDEDPTYETLTGFTAPSGSQPSNACDDAPTGYSKGCRLTARLGLKRFDTQEIEINKVMLRVNRGDFRDLRLAGEILGDTGLAPGNMSQDQILNVITAMEMMRTAAYMEQALHTDIWQGTVAAGSFPGLMYQVATGQVDTDTNTACPSLDSDVKDFNYNDVCGTGLDIVEYLSAMMYFLESLATDTGLAPVGYKIAMRPQLWFELSACWPCNYLTNRCRTAQVGFNAAVINDNVNVNMRDDMRARSQIPINGVWYDVVEDTGIYEANNANDGNLAAGQFASSIFAIPVTVRAREPVTFREHLDYRGAAADETFLSPFGAGAVPWIWTDNGSYSWSISAIRWCYSLSLKTEQRVVLRTPQLAGVLQNVMYSPLQHLREPDFDSPYHVDGGISLRSEGTRYAVWM